MFEYDPLKIVKILLKPVLNRFHKIVLQSSISIKNNTALPSIESLLKKVVKERFMKQLEAMSWSLLSKE